MKNERLKPQVDHFRKGFLIIGMYRYKRGSLQHEFKINCISMEQIIV